VQDSIFFIFQYQANLRLHIFYFNIMSLFTEVSPF